ncbi:GspH/FimT family pseudopilin [Paraherbaspirillum soli]|uniref:Type II secretion system protein H n=1 Tax=Paraherbaspirillum soli TaxID=631222 RepID=A0ABW0MBS4_9BURK
MSKNRVAFAKCGGIAIVNSISFDLTQFALTGGICNDRDGPRQRLNQPGSLLRVAGFTLVELLITITVLAILLGVAAPSFQTMVLNQRESAQADGLVNALNYARNTALSQIINIQACPSGTSGSTTCGASWGAGWMIVSQPPTGAATLLQSHPTAANGPVLSAVPIGGTAASSVTFDPRGLATTQANFKVCDSRGAKFARSVQVLPTGFIQSGPTPGLAVWDGSALTCP